MGHLAEKNTSSTDNFWPRFRAIAVPSASFALVGIVLYPLWLRITWPWLVLPCGLAATLSNYYHYGPGPSSRIVEALLWAIGMQVLWLPYWTIICKRPMSRRDRIRNFLSACLAVIVVNGFAFRYVGGPCMML